ALADQLLRELGVAKDVTLQLNTLGDAQTRSAWRDALVAHFSGHMDVLSPESRERLQKNPLRILDSKAEGDKALVADAPRIDAFMTAEAGAFFEAVQKGLQASGVAFVRADSLVRGFDYYRHTAFEFVTDALGAQGTVIGGGRYDGLIGMMGGPETPAVGWAGGIERLAMLVAEPLADAPLVAVVPETHEMESEAAAIAAHLRNKGISVAMAYRGNAKRRAELAARAGAKTILYVKSDAVPGRRLNLSDRMKDGNETDRLLLILGNLPADYAQLSGEGAE
ncbi:ATP phosphoribosyltransferase regulatory subunit, partial [Sandarakinorhabdus sp.]|uniref:ATP phosphoribosyltransferase regulatory subunit n=1 Tax=Sandarakinorhabdus sp. TaxID=1916663 RepID=UPI00286E2B18